jgi:hypothetical protein
MVRIYPRPPPNFVIAQQSCTIKKFECPPEPSEVRCGFSEEKNGEGGPIRQFSLFAILTK